ncbi:SpoIIAA-like protein [Actinocorallia herbida]|uniref:SpoIIAA-like protein n=2 Tax=Actinocorallia herbida TaxID=58109 RepID=A0A3N1CVX5_9ACTN|nr:SpoIIAA-like protein [Actinocorallia herbida]
MLERLEGLPAGVYGVRAVGTLSREDYETVIVPVVEEARKEGRKLRVLSEVGPDFHGLTPGAMWEDLKVGSSALRLFEGCAIVTDTKWIRESTRLASFFMPCPVRVFPLGEREAAAAWLSTLPEGPGVSHRLVPESNVMVIEVAAPLRAQDFEALAQTADTWLATHAELAGIVVHVRTFPGWENVKGLLKHARFVRDHHRRVRRAALVSDSRVADLAPALVNHFVHAEVRHFDYADLDAAIAWAGAAPVQKVGDAG